MDRRPFRPARDSRRCASWLLLLILLGALWAPGSAAEPAQPAPGDAEPRPPASMQINPDRLHPALRRALLDPAAPAACPADEACAHRAEQTADGFLPIVVEWRSEPVPAAEVSAIPDRLARRQALVAALQAEAQRSSGALQADLQTAAARGLARNVRAFWVSPVIALEARPELIADLSRRADVAQIRPDEKLVLEDADFRSVPAPATASNLPWNLDLVNAGLARDALRLDGTGVVLANLDTGVDWQHPALLTKYRGYREKGLAVHRGNWHVSTNEPYLYPGDGNGHGTHTMGTMVGEDDAGKRIGVAPGARWIAVKLFTNSGYTYESWIHDAFQWVMAPAGDFALAPDVINNSWGSQISSDDRYRPDLKALRAAGILPVFAAGNDGPGPGTIDSPGSTPEALAVGAVDPDKRVASFSGRGPSPWKEIKPELAAPGTNIVSAFPGGGYAEGAGTSMAAPHVAGLAALLLQASPNLTPDQIEQLLVVTAQPLGSPAPNNATGHGLVNAYAAGLRVTASGELLGRVVRPDGGGIAQAAVTVTRRDTGPAVTIAGDAAGRFTLALQPGRYDVTARAFGFDPAARYGVDVATGAQTGLAITLTAQPAGSLFGRVTDLATGAPLSATISVAETPVRVQTDPNTGLYSLALPAGDYRATVTAAAHRIGHIAERVAVGAGQLADVALPRGPHILLVDSGRWYYKSKIRYFEDALAALDYPYDLWSIRDPFGQHDSATDRPTKDALSPYDLVIWSAPLDSPGLIGAGDAITGYLRGGGHLLVTGQDVAYWDAGGSPMDPPAKYLTEDMGLSFISEGNLGDLTGVPRTPFEGAVLALNTSDSSRDQYDADAAAVTNGLLTRPAFRWADESIGAATAGVCRPYRAAWLGFGLEGAGPQPARVDALRRFMGWFEEPPAPYGLAASASPAPLIGLPGTSISHTIRVDSTGIATDTIRVLLEGGTWPLDLELPDGRHVPGDSSFRLAGCASAALTATITLPPGLASDARSIHTLRLVSQGDPTVAATVTLTAKTPAPILFVDDERWYFHGDRYTTTLDALKASFDTFDTRGSRIAPAPDTLKRYPLVVWATGYDWLTPLTEADESHLGAYLDAGGRLLLSSQDLMDVNGDDPFVAERLGVVGASLNITATEVSGVNGGPLREGLGPWPLTYPFRNWSDGLYLAPAARATLHDAGLHTVAAARPAAAWRTAFFSFPLETLDAAPRRTLLGRTLLWLSPLGESRLQAPPVAAGGSRIPVTLTLGLADAAPRAGLGATLPLLPETTLVPGSVRGPWAYDAATDALVWAGDLAPGAPITLGAELQLAAGIPAGTLLPLAARLDAGDGLVLPAEAPVQVDVPWLTLALAAPDGEIAPGAVLDFELTAANRGAVDATAQLTQTLPAGLQIVPGSPWASAGQIVSAAADRLTWTGTLPPGAQAVIRFRAAVAPQRPRDHLIARADLTDQHGRLVSAWAAMYVAARVYLPVIMRGG